MPAIHFTNDFMRGLMILIALHFASCSSSLTLLIGESWRVRYALIPCFPILQRPLSEAGSEMVRPACPPGQMVAHHLLSHLQEADVRGSRPLRGIWRMPGRSSPGLSCFPPPPTSPDWLPRPLLSCTPPLDTLADIWSTQLSNISRGHSHKLYKNNHFGFDASLHNLYYNKWWSTSSVVSSSI